MFAITLLNWLSSAAVSYLFARYILANIESAGGRRAQFRVPFWGFVGLQLLGAFLFLTIIGWAWIIAWMYRWTFEHLHIEGAMARLNVTGWGLLWRTVVCVLASLPILTIPWTYSWFYGWLVNSVEIHPNAASDAAVRADTPPVLA